MADGGAWEGPARGGRPAVVAAGLVLALAVGAVLSRSDEPPAGAPARATDPPAQALATAPLGRWDPVPASPLTPRTAPVAVWTGAEALVWGGVRSGAGLRDGAAFDPATRTWRALPEAPLPWTRASTRGAVWTGHELVVLIDGATPRTLVYDPRQDRWRLGADPPRLLRWQATCALGRDVVVFGTERDLPGRQVLRYEPVADRWQYIAAPPVRAAGRAFACSPLGDGLALVAYARSRLSVTVLDRRGSWTAPVPLPAGDVLGVRRVAAVEDPVGRNLVVTGAVPDSREHRAWSWSRGEGWRALPLLPLPPESPTPLLAYSGELLLAWVADAPRPGLGLRPGRDAHWRPLAPAPLAPGRHGTTLWTGELLLVWDGSQPDGAGAAGAVFEPAGET